MTGPDVPYQPSSFVGRERELDKLTELVPAARLVTLTGPGGIGKTRLALQTLRTLAGSPAFPDGARFVELADLNHPDMVAPRIAAALGVSEEQGRPLLDTVADALRSRRVLLALDNCEHLIGACAEACQAILTASGDPHILATSREPLRVGGEAVLPVPPLAVATGMERGAAADGPRLPEATILFTERAVAALPAFAVTAASARAINEICRSLGGIPLAIELAAARVRTLSASQIAERLADRFALLTTGDRTAPPRQRTLRAAIDWSYDLLTPPEQALLRRLSVFAGWSLEMAERVCADDGGAGPAQGAIRAADMLDLLSALVDKSLVAPEPEALNQARYRLPDTIRQYAADKLTASGEGAAVQRRHRAYVLAVTERNYAVGMARVPASWGERVDVFRRYDVDASNLWQALNQCLADGDLATGMRICTAVRPVWLVRGEYRLGSAWLEGFLSAPGASDVPPGIRGPALVGRAQLLLSSDPSTAELVARDGLRCATDAADDYWTVAARNALSEIARHTGRPAEAEAMAREALGIAKGAGDTWGEGYCLANLAAVEGLRLNLTAARELASASLAVMRSIDHAWGAARAQLGLADLAQLQADPDDARRRYTAALETLREVNARPDIARCLVGLGRVALSVGQADVARGHLTESIRLCRDTGARIGVARGLEALAALAIQEDDPERAVLLVAGAAALRRDGGLPPIPAPRVERYLAPARGVGEDRVARLWAEGLDMGAEAAIELAMSLPKAPSATNRAPQVPAQVTPGPLSARELQVAILVAKGRSNKDIARELYISPATAARHIANIMRKLDVHTRTEIAIWTTRHLAGRPG
jgi:predicted ATPase/DNA-binding CsgD family transcriptional regulator/tetratricopeptide (TPR) repeat protein